MLDMMSRMPHIMCISDAF